MRFFILGNDRKPQVVEAATRLRPVFERLGKVVAFDLRQEQNLSPLTADIAVVFGGDGAILRAARQLGYRQIPVLGVNLGKLGFLADLSTAELAQSLPKIVAGDYRVASHLMFECEYLLDGKPQVVLGLNEVVIHTRDASHVIEVDVLIDGEAVTAFSGDGLIISTPIGSTAHSLSAGGPILSQELPAFTVTPICPHTLTHRPLVDSAEKLYTIRVRRPEGAMLTADGQSLATIADGAAVSIRKAPVSFQLVKVPGRTYYQTLRDKLRWGAPPNYRTELPGT